MSAVYIWLIAYALPAIVSGAAIKLLPRKKDRLSKRNAAIIHAALAVSTCFSQYFIHASGRVFPWYPNPLSIIVYLASVLIAIIFIGRIGLWYGLSALLQQLTMVSTAFLLLPVLPFYAVALLLVPLYVWGHSTQGTHRLMKILLFTVWGVASLFLFSVLPNVYLIASLHTLLGAMLISRSILYPEVVSHH